MFKQDKWRGRERGRGRGRGSDRPKGNGKHRMVTAKYPDDDTSRTRPCEESARPGKSDQGGGKTDLTANII